VRQRHPAFDPSKEDISSYSTGERMARYVDEAVPLAVRRSRVPSTPPA